MVDQDNTYLVHGAVITCNLGLRASNVVLQMTHGVFLKKCPQVTDKDCVGKDNILDFCGCHSAENPYTIEKAKEIADYIANETGENFENEVVDIFCNDSMGSVPVMDCAGKCDPIIVSETWDEVKDTVKTDGANTVKGTATLKCLYGGVIEIIDVGQPEE